VGGITWEAIQRINAPESMNAFTVIIVATAGVIVNGLSAVLFMSGKKDINIWSAFMHLASDAAVSCWTPGRCPAPRLQGPRQRRTWLRRTRLGHTGPKPLSSET
jgi:hypothetical protein